MSRILAPLLSKGKEFNRGSVAPSRRARCVQYEFVENRAMDTNDKKKAKLTPEQTEECARLRSLYDAARASGALKKTQAQIASDLKIGNQSMVVSLTSALVVDLLTSQQGGNKK